LCFRIQKYGFTQTRPKPQAVFNDQKESKNNDIYSDFGLKHPYKKTILELFLNYANRNVITVI